MVQLDIILHGLVHKFLHARPLLPVTLLDCRAQLATTKGIYETAQHLSGQEQVLGWNACAKNLIVCLVVDFSKSCYQIASELLVGEKSAILAVVVFHLNLIDS